MQRTNIDGLSLWGQHSCCKRSRISQTIQRHQWRCAGANAAFWNVIHRIARLTELFQGMRKETYLPLAGCRFIAQLCAIAECAVNRSQDSLDSIGEGPTVLDAASIRRCCAQKGTGLHVDTSIPTQNLLAKFVAINHRIVSHFFHMRAFDAGVLKNAWVSASGLFSGVREGTDRPVMTIVLRTRQNLTSRHTFIQ